MAGEILFFKKRLERTAGTWSGVKAYCFAPKNKKVKR